MGVRGFLGSIVGGLGVLGSIVVRGRSVQGMGEFTKMAATSPPTGCAGQGQKRESERELGRSDKVRREVLWHLLRMYDAGG